MRPLTPPEKTAAVRVLARRYAELACWREVTPTTLGRFDDRASLGQIEMRERTRSIVQWAQEADLLREAIGKLVGAPPPSADPDAFLRTDYSSDPPDRYYSSTGSTREKRRICKVIMGSISA